MNKEQHIPTGYKNSPLGIIPNEWDVKRFDEIAPLQRGFDLPIDNIIKGDFPVVFSNGILKYHNESKVKGPGIVTGRSGTIGKVHYVKSDFWPHNTTLWVTDMCNNNISYLYYFIQFINLIKFVAGSGVPTLNRNDVHSKKYAIPPLAEQERIAKLLSVWDKAIESQTKLISLLEKRKRALMQRLLTAKTRLPGFTEPWKKKELGEILSYEQPTKYLVKDTEYDIRFKIPVLTAGKTFILGYINEEFGICSKLPVILFDDFTTASKYVDFKFKVKSSAAKLLYPKKGNNIKFIYEVMQQIKYVVGGHERHWISKYSFLTLLIPSLEEQKAIAEILSVADSEIDIAKSKLQSLCTQKRALMQQLLTGKKRIKI